MPAVNVHQVKTNLSHYLNLVEHGETVIIAKRNVPIAQLTPINKPKSTRKLGQTGINFDVPDSFFEPLPPKIANSFINPK